ncbi:MAG: hypothetical protein KatS3mg119_0008 [Rhodothalassiaceae bacterium]|nr:MAG: hypothetical protein KatS3mg119_0008 [Rhodothalassiaceae bacterium]
MSARCPFALVERVEVITGGASAIYGADAVSGVVNFIIRDDFQGLILDAQYAPQDNRGSAGDSYRFSAVAGGNFADGTRQCDARHRVARD